MTITHRLVLGFGMLVTMLVAVIAYHNAVVGRFASTYRDVSITTLPVAQSSFRMETSVQEQEELVRKLFAYPEDPRHVEIYTQKLDEVRRSFGALLNTSEHVDLTPTKAEAFDSIRALWQRGSASARTLLPPDSSAPSERGESGAAPTNLQTRASTLERAPSADQASESERDGEEAADRPAESAIIAETEFAELTRLRMLQEAIAGLRNAADHEVRLQQKQIEADIAVLERSNRVMLIAALVSSLAIVFFTSRSIRGSLKRLTEATRAVADGRFSYQLDASGDDELSRVAAAFNTMTRRLEALDRMKKDFVARVSHDLRTPLVAMQETTDLLLTGLAGTLSEQQMRLVRLNRESGRRLGGRITNLLALSRIEAGAFELDIKPHDLGELVRFVLREVLGPARRRGLSLAVDLPTSPVALRCDNERLTQVLENLLDNAIKYSPQGGHLEVRARAVDHAPAHRLRTWSEPGHVEISVADSGAGIPEADRVKVFESFYRAGAAPATRGTGLGLAICRDLVEAHNGLIWVDDRPGGGARFWVALPWRPATFESPSDSADRGSGDPRPSPDQSRSPSQPPASERKASVPPATGRSADESHRREPAIPAGAGDPS